MGIEFLPARLELPSSPVVIHGLPGWKAVGQITPLAAGALDVEDGVEDDEERPFAFVVLALSGKVFLEDSVLGFGKIRWVGFHRG